MCREEMRRERRAEERRSGDDRLILHRTRSGQFMLRLGSRVISKSIHTFDWQINTAAARHTHRLSLISAPPPFARSQQRTINMSSTAAPPAVAAASPASSSCCSSSLTSSVSDSDYSLVGVGSLVRPDEKAVKISKLIFLGTGSAIPSPGKRNTSSMALIMNNATTILLDCGKKQQHADRHRERY